MKGFFLGFLLLFFYPKAFALGYLESDTYNRYVGWACRSGDENPVGIHIYASNVIIGGGNAPNPREFAVGQACETSASNHGFDISVDVPAHMQDGSVRSVIVYAIYADGTSAALDNMPVQIKFNALPGRQRPSSVGDIVGRDLAYSWAEINYFGHIGIWDGSQVIEAVGTSSMSDTIKLTPWESFSGGQGNWPTLTPVTKDFPQTYCSDTMCANNTSTAFYPWIYPQKTKTGPEREIAARRAYISYLIGASYTRLGTYTPTRQGTGRFATELCNPLSLNSCRPPLYETKPQRGEYRCESFVFHSWAASAIGTGYGTVGQILYWEGDRKKAQQWDAQMNYIISPARVRYPRAIYDAFGRWN